jgi:CubicO group peptidase (beta-lactamase class C family)
VLLASIVEKVSGVDFIDFSTEKLFKPAGLDNTAIRNKKEKLEMENMAWGYIFDVEKQQYMPADSFPYTDYGTYLGARKGPGRVSSNATDLLKWEHYLANETLFTNNTLKTAYTPAQLNNGNEYPYGFGWEVLKDDNGKQILKHNGSNPGYKNTFIRLPDKQRTIILLTNNQPPEFERLVKDFVQIIAE